MARLESMGLVLILTMSWMMMSAHLSAGKLALPPAADCSSELTELLPCLDFLTNASASLVSPACCSGLTNVSTASPLCLCQFITSNVNQSAMLGINDTRALQLPTFCNVNANPASCAALLGPAMAPLPFALGPALSPKSLAPAAGGPEMSPGSPEASVTPAPASDCSVETASLIGCLDFLSGKDNSPSKDCCTHLGDVVNTEPGCLCSLISSSGSSSVVAGINVTQALELPALCKVPASLGECPGVSLPPSANQGPTTPSKNSGVEPSAAARPFAVITLAVAAIVYFCNKQLYI